MSNPETKSEFNPLGRIASLVGLLAVALYFAGWAYRWAYFGYFKIQVTSLNLPLESFYLAAFRSLFGDFIIFLRTILCFGIVIPVIAASLYTIHFIKLYLKRFLSHKRELIKRYFYPQLYLRRFLLKIFSLNLNTFQLKSLRFLGSMINELIIVFWILFTIYHLSLIQAKHDTLNDVVNDTSKLPVVTVVIQENNASLGKKAKDPFSISEQPNVRIIGDLKLYKTLLDSISPYSWRLLCDIDGYLYIFPALPSTLNKENWNVPVLKIYESGNGDQLTILSPTVK